MEKKKVLILGGGFAGVEAAIQLRKYNFEVSLISNRDYLYIYPISIWIPTGEIEFEDAKLPLKKLADIHNFELIIDEVESIKSLEKRVECANNIYTYDYLVIAIGAAKMKPKGIENTLSICGSPNEALEIKKRIDELIKRGEGSLSFGFGGNPKDPSAVRGGPAFELMFNVHHKLKKLGIRDKFTINFFAPMPKPGAKMGPKALNGMDMMFKKMNINKYVGKKIKEFTKEGVVFEDDSLLKSDFTMFIPGGVGNPVFKKSDLPLNEAGFIKINGYCEVVHDYDSQPDKYNVFAIGDSAAIDGPDWRAKQGHLAEVMAKVVAYNINEIEKGSIHRQEYLNHLNIICVMDTGDGAAFIYRDDSKAIMFPMPVIGHWMKKGWGWYYKNSKLKKIPRLPGM